MIVTDSERLVQIKQYVMAMSPIFRPSVLLSPAVQAFNDGYDKAMARAQADLLFLLGDS